MKDNNFKEVNHDFGWAIKALKEGKSVLRSGWNGKNMYLYYVPSHTKDEKYYDAYIMMYTAIGTNIPWLASQSDALSEDWEIKKEK